jgi:hypothetical protein
MDKAGCIRRSGPHQATTRALSWFGAIGDIARSRRRPCSARKGGRRQSSPHLPRLRKRGPTSPLISCPDWTRSSSGAGPPNGSSFARGATGYRSNPALAGIVGPPARVHRTDHLGVVDPLRIDLHGDRVRLCGRDGRSQRREVGHQVRRVRLEEIHRLGQAAESPGAKASQADSGCERRVDHPTHSRGQHGLAAVRREADTCGGVDR